MANMANTISMFDVAQFLTAVKQEFAAAGRAEGATGGKTRPKRGSAVAHAVSASTQGSPRPKT